MALCLYVRMYIFMATGNALVIRVGRQKTSNIKTEISTCQSDVGHLARTVTSKDLWNDQ